jgi:hypothetical protein
MNELADHQAFIEAGQPVENPLFEATITQICQSLFGPVARPAALLVISIPEHRFFHTPLMVGGRIGGAFYFDDIDTGMTAISANMLSGDVKYTRFSLTVLKDAPPQSRH